MTFTEAAVEVLRIAKKPLHYKKITEIAISNNLLSHVGRTPETTMSSRLTTMVKKDRGDAPILKIKPGVFGLREFSASVLANAEKESGLDYKVNKADFKAIASENEAPNEVVASEVEADDVPLIQALADDKAQNKVDGEGEGRKRKRRRKKKGESAEGSASSGERASRSGRSARKNARAGQRGVVEGDWDRALAANEPAGRSLVEEIEAVLKQGRKEPRSLITIAEALVQNKILSGSARSLVPTLAAAIRADVAAREASSHFTRFVLDGEYVAHADWSSGRELVRARTDALRAARRQREAAQKSLLKSLRDLPTAGFLELVATWLNTQGIDGLRGVRAPIDLNGCYYLAGVKNQGPRSVPVAILIAQSEQVGSEHVVALRGSLPHFGGATEAWIVSTLQIARETYAESVAPGALPITLFSGIEFARALEDVGIGMRRRTATLLELDSELLAALRGPDDDGDKDDADASDVSAQAKGRRRGRRGRADDESATSDEKAASVQGDELTAGGDSKTQVDEHDRHSEDELGVDDQNGEAVVSAASNEEDAIEADDQILERNVTETDMTELLVHEGDDPPSGAHLLSEADSDQEDNDNDDDE